MSIYINNAATSWPKPESVPKAMFDFLNGRGANLGRGAASKRDVDTFDMVISCREEVASLLGGYKDGDARYVTFTSNITESLNIVLKGYLKPGMTIGTTGMEHNAVIRPLRKLEQNGVKVIVFECDSSGRLDLEKYKNYLKDNSLDMMVMSHASNLCGTIQDIESVAGICSEKEIPFVLDTAQTAGVLPLSAFELKLAALCFTGHKGLMGPQGIGGIVWEPSFAERCDTFIEGGTGSFSHEEVQPTKLPDKFEAGTPNLPGIAGLLAAVTWIKETCVSSVHDREMELGARLLEGLKTVPGITLYGCSGMEGRLPVFAMNIEGQDNGIIAADLAENGIETRPGLHCAPLAHKTVGSFPQGALRISVGYFSSEEDVDETVAVLKKVTAAG